MEQNLTEIRQFGISFARLIADLAVDPHGYFEKQYAARIENAQSAQEIRGVIAHLVRWVESPVISAQERETLDRELAKRGLPSIDDIRMQQFP